MQASQEVWLASSCLLLLSLENFILVSTTPRAPRGLWGMALAHGLLPHAWAWMCFFHLGFARRVQSQRLAEWWQYVPEVTLVASRCLAALGWRRREAIPSCMLAMTVDGQRPRWPGTASGQLLLTGPTAAKVGDSHSSQSGACARAGQRVCRVTKNWLLVTLHPLLVHNCINTSVSWSCVSAPALSLLVLITFQVLPWISGKELAWLKPQIPSVKAGVGQESPVVFHQASVALALRC